MGATSNTWPLWAKLHPTELRCTLLSFAAHCWAMLHPLSYIWFLLIYLSSSKFLKCRTIGIRSVRYGSEEKKNADAGSSQVLEYIDVKLGMWWGHLSTLLSTILYFYGNFWPKSKDFVLKFKIPYGVFPLTYQLYTFVLTGLRKGFSPRIKKTYGFPQTYQLCFFVFSSPEQRLAYTWVCDGTESKLCKNWSPIWCVQTGFCPKRYRSLHDRSLETVNWFSYWILRPMTY